jgi:5,10-methylenetetrahydromethanopterin reductase
VTTLEEVLVVVRRLLAGERGTMHGREVHLDDVELDQPPPEPPPLGSVAASPPPSYPSCTTE